jgi:uncharacterized membrane protein YphA (DoxX/SURF4 family)
MELIAMSTLAGILVILGVIVALVALITAVWVLVAAIYTRTRGGAGRREEHRPQAVGRVWRLWQGRG